MGAYNCDWCNQDHGVFSSTWHVISDGIEWFICPICRDRWTKHGIEWTYLYPPIPINRSEH